jgi:hypothetical protein
MKQFFEAVDLKLSHVKAIVAAMLKVAQSDGLHEAELVLIREFYVSCQRDIDGFASFQDLLAEGHDLASQLGILDSFELKQVCLKSCALLAFADGSLSEGEKRALLEVATQLQLDPEAYQAILENVRDLLLRQLAPLTNLDELRAVAREMEALG